MSTPKPSTTEGIQVMPSESESGYYTWQASPSHAGGTTVLRYSSLRPCRPGRGHEISVSKRGHRVVARTRRRDSLALQAESSRTSASSSSSLASFPSSSVGLGLGVPSQFNLKSRPRPGCQCHCQSRRGGPGALASYRAG